ncbi:septum formation initiator family protein [Bacillus sp. 31A1R]|uniref:Septum formation initiator family protein n=1 Tax=Robertmurraya mangrovi TaxID=3098077 RepID=A0ABU5J4H3_9BACI|nr:septum formation initiator family protein [Bacillus sp. 31A1R]MDZ5474319.1 septum formation initiator family protein [Bacillus sp. 31A1R]
MSAIKKHIPEIHTSYAKQREGLETLTARKRVLLFRRLTIFFVFAVLVSYLMISTLISQSASLEEMKAEKALLDQELASLEKQEAILGEEIVKLNDDEYIAKLARDEYFLSEKGDIIFKLPKSKKENKSDESAY